MKSFIPDTHATTRKIIAVIASITLAIVTAKLILRGIGISRPLWDDILLVAGFSLFISSSKKAFYYFWLPVTLIYAIYFPVGANYGAPGYQHIVSAIATDVSESQEFLSLIPTKYYLYALAIFCMTLLVRIIIYKGHINYTKNKTFLIAVFLLAIFQLPPFTLFHKFYDAAKIVEKDLGDLERFSSQNNWGKSTLINAHYDNYVLVIGESARKDYMHAYGYTIANTPFMSTANGMVIDGLYSPDKYTIGSLRLMLTKPDKEKWEPDYSHNLINLIKSAGIETYWISNQGYIGVWDTPVSGIAANSDKKYFLKSAGASSMNSSDFSLLPVFEKFLHEKTTDHKRFFVLHLYGSHTDACDRVSDFPLIFKPEHIAKEHQYINCYISSIQKTDEFLKRAYTILQKSGQSFSMIYFADHGLSHAPSPNGTVLRNDTGSSVGTLFRVPFFKISSDDNARSFVKSFKSGLNFTEGIANWIGIQNPSIDSSINLFSGQDDPSDYGQRQNRIDNSHEDPPIVPTVRNP